MTRDEFLDRQFSVSFTAGMNQSYHQYKITEYQRWDRSAKIATCIVATLGAVLSVATAFPTQGHLVPWGIALSLIAAIGTFGVLFAPFGDWSRWHTEMFRKWTTLRRNVDALEYELSGEPTESQIKCLGEVTNAMHDLCRDEETRADEKRLRKCEAAERRKRGMPVMMEKSWFGKPKPV